VAVRLAVVDLVRQVAVVRVADDGRAEFPHALRGTLAAMLAVPAWHVVVVFANDAPPHDGKVEAVLDQAQKWAAERGCRLSVTRLRDVGRVATERNP
jgi:hypothetical protein